MRKKCILIISAYLACLLVVPALYAAADGDKESYSLDEIAKELSNPVTTLASVRTDIEYRTYQGDLPKSSDQSNTVFMIKPSLPIPLKNGKNILMRATIPIYVDMPAWQVPFGHPMWIQDYDYPDFRLRQSPQITEDTGGYHSLHGHVGDIGFDVAYGGVSDSGFISMYGMAIVLENSTNLSASRNQTLLGPEVAFGKINHWGVIGAWVTHLTNVTEGDVRAGPYGTNETNIEVFFNYGLGNGWQVFSEPTITYDWEADSGNELLLPLGVGIAKTTRIGKMPLKLAVEIQKFVISPDRFGTNWLFTFSVTPVFSNPFER